VVPPAIRNASGAAEVVTGLLLAAFDYEEYKGAASKKKAAEDPAPKSVNVTILTASKSDRDQINRAQIIAESQNFARTIAHRPRNDIKPPPLATDAQSMAREVGLKCRVLDEKQMARLGMGGILAVGSGSSQIAPPRMIVLEHQGRVTKGRAKPLLLVGKA